VQKSLAGELKKDTDNVQTEIQHFKAAAEEWKQEKIVKV